MSSKLLNNFFGALSGGVSTAAINLVSIPILLKAFGIKGYGELAIILSTYLIVQTLTSLQPWQAFIKYWYDDGFDKKNSLIFSLLLDVVSCAIGGIFLFVVFTSNLYEKYLFDIDVDVVIVFSLAMLCNPFSFFIGVCRVKDKFLFISFCEFTRAVIRFFGAVTALSYNAFFIYSFFYLLSNFVVVLMSILVMRNDFFKTISYIKDIRKSDINDFFIFGRFSLLVSIKSIVDLPVQHLDKILVSSILGNGSVAVYDIAKRINQGFGVIINVINQISYPYIVRAIRISGLTYVTKKVYKITFFAIFLVFFIVLFLLCFNQYAYNLYNAIFGLSVLNFEFNMYYTAVFLLSSCFLLIHVTFQAAGLVGKDIKILLLANSIYFLVSLYCLESLGLYALILAYSIQIMTVLIFKFIFLNIHKKHIK